MSYTFIFMQNSDTNKLPLTVTTSKFKFWCVVSLLLILTLSVLYYFFVIVKPKDIEDNLVYLEKTNKSFSEQNSFLIDKNKDLSEKMDNLQNILKEEQVKSAELQAQASIVEKIKQESLGQIEEYRQKLEEKEKMLQFFNDLVKPATKENLQCFNMSVDHKEKYIDYGVNLLLDKKNDLKKDFRVELRLVTGKDNMDIANSKIMELKPDAVRNISMLNSMRLTGRIAENNKLKGIKILDVRVFEQDNELAAQCWKVF